MIFEKNIIIFVLEYYAEFMKKPSLLNVYTLIKYYKNAKHTSGHISIFTLQQLDCLYAEGLQMALAGSSFSCYF